MDLLIGAGIFVFAKYLDGRRESFQGEAREKPLETASEMARKIPIHFDPYSRTDAYPKAFDRNAGLYDTVTEDAGNRSDLLMKSATPAHDPPRSSTGYVLKGNAMRPYFRSAKAQHHSDALSERRMDLFTGSDAASSGWGLRASADDAMSAPPPMFQPTPNVVPKTVQRDDGRIVASMYHSNTGPVERVLVGRGINVGPDVPASGGFHEMNRVVPDNVGSYKKVSLPGRVVPGKDVVGFTPVAPLEPPASNGRKERDPFSRGMEPSAGVGAPRVLPDSLSSLRKGSRDNEAPVGAAKHPVGASKGREDEFTRSKTDDTDRGASLTSNLAGRPAGGYTVTSDVVLRWTQKRGSEPGSFGQLQASRGGAAYSSASEIARPRTGREAYGETSQVGLGQALRASGAAEASVATTEVQAPGTNRGSAHMTFGPASVSVKARGPDVLPPKQTGRSEPLPYSGNPVRGGLGGYDNRGRIEDRSALGDVGGRAPGPQNTGGMRILETLVPTPAVEHTKGTVPKFQVILSHPPSSDVRGSSLAPDAYGAYTSTGTLGEVRDPRSDDLDVARRQLFGNPLAKDIGCP